jgi:NAD(P)-dependent dehydrogenase (short-subunit alcohol dehydrogenase family)
MLSNKTAIVTGAGKGLGQEIAKAFAAKGASVVLVSKTPEGVNELARELNTLGRSSIAICADIRKAESVQELVRQALEAFGRIDILINNAGISYISSVALSDESRWKEVIDTNVIGTYLCCKYVGKKMLAQRRGQIVNVSSIAAQKGVPFCSAYSASKAAIIGLTRTMAVELARHEISVNAVCPGPIEGLLSEHARGEWAKMYGFSSEEFQKNLMAGIPNRRFVNVQDVVETIAFLASDSAKDITGQSICIDGGSSIA